VAPVITAVALAGAPAALTISSTDRLVAGASAGACSIAASAARGDGGRGFHLSGGHPPSLSSSYSSDDDEFSGVAEGESPCCSCNRYSSFSYSRRSHR
jgi:hypothetical protein